ncbi:unnamed protein product [Cercospora beticola]|nr:unnamed protein product [Cercospora beticola]
MSSHNENAGLEAYSQRANYRHYGDYQHATVGPVVILTPPMDDHIYILPHVAWRAMFMAIGINHNMIRLEDHIDGRAAWTPLEYLKKVVAAGGVKPPIHYRSPSLETILRVDRELGEISPFDAQSSSEEGARGGDGVDDGRTSVRQDTPAHASRDADMRDAEQKDKND